MGIIIIVIFSVILVLLGSNYLYKKTNYYYNECLETNKLFEKKRVNIVNTGSTFAFYGIDYKYSKRNGINLALKPQSLKMDFEMLKRFCRQMEANAIVLIVISDLAFAVDNYSNREAFYKYYKILKKDAIPFYSLLKKIQVKYFPVTLYWKNYFRYFKDVRKDVEYEISVNQNDIEYVHADALKKAYSWCTEFGLHDLQDASALGKFEKKFQITTSILKDMIAWCHDNHFRPVLVNLPISSELANLFSKEFLYEIYYKNLESVINKGTPTIDLSKNEKLSDYYLYLDSARLNSAGREIVTKIIDRKLDEMGYEY